MGYHQAGFDVIGVDIKPQPRYPFDFIQGDALVVLDNIRWAAAYHASPPCRDHSVLANVCGTVGTGHLLADTRSVLKEIGKPYVIENVEGADMPGALVLCGSEFGLTTTTERHGRVWLKRHRKFESNVFLFGAGGCNCYGKLTVPVYGGGAGGNRVNMRGPGVAQAGREVMGIDWMTRDELDQAIPPAYTRFVGEQLIERLSLARAS
jgi:DNA (cytosine-5)-methyltransferase 1